jgi:hypothetical protein
MSDDISGNPFQDLLALGERIREQYERRALFRAHDEAVPDPPPNSENELARLRLACLASARATGYPPPEVERRVNALVLALKYMLMFPMFGPWPQGSDLKFAEVLGAADKTRGLVEALAAQLKVPPGGGRTPSRGVPLDPPAPAAPAEYLLSWRAILGAVGMKNTIADRQQLRTLNNKYEGPIIMPERGGQPKVDKGKLRPWWDGLESRWVEDRKEAEEKRRDREEATGERHSYGRNGEIVPDIGGHVKKRRTKPGT